MSDDFRTGRPPSWRVVLYAIIAMAIPVYFFYPRLGELSPPIAGFVLVPGRFSRWWHGGIFRCAALDCCKFEGRSTEAQAIYPVGICSCAGVWHRV